MSKTADQGGANAEQRVEAMRTRYRLERDRRLRPDGVAQYVSVAGDMADVLDDPHCSVPRSRGAVEERMDVLIIGCGFGGLLLAARLIEAGVSDIRLVDRAADVGGTWYWNRYPGVACDVEAYSYLPLLEEMGMVPPRKYARGEEILDYCRAIARRYAIDERCHFQTEVSEARWDENDCRWRVSTQQGDLYHARFLCMSTGPLHRPKLPGIPGIESFKGHRFHTSRWDYAYTGGDQHGDLSRLADKAVGIVGTGATAVQCIPHLGAAAKQLYVFQRTPSSIDIRADGPTDPDWAASLEPGWHSARVRDFTAMTTASPLVDASGKAIPEAEAAALRDGMDLAKMDALRQRIDEIVVDPETAERLKPYYKYLCKRPCFSDDYLPTFNRANVRLVDTGGRGVDRITENSVIVDGQTYPVDCLIFATGFEFGTDYAQRCGFETFGRGGVSQTDAWRDGVSTLYGLHSRGFPNRFIVGNAQQASTTNFTHMLDIISRHLAHVLKACLDKGIAIVEPTEEAERAWVNTIVNMPTNRAALDPDCTPNYFNFEGDRSERAVRNGFYGGSAFDFIDILDKWRRDDTMPGLHLA